MYITYEQAKLVLQAIDDDNSTECKRKEYIELRNELCKKLQDIENEKLEAERIAERLLEGARHETNRQSYNRGIE